MAVVNLEEDDKATVAISIQMETMTFKYNESLSYKSEGVTYSQKQLFTNTAETLTVPETTEKDFINQVTDSQYHSEESLTENEENLLLVFPSEQSPESSINHSTCLHDKVNTQATHGAKQLAKSSSKVHHSFRLSKRRSHRRTKRRASKRQQNAFQPTPVGLFHMERRFTKYFSLLDSKDYNVRIKQLKDFSRKFRDCPRTGAREGVHQISIFSPSNFSSEHEKVVETFVRKFNPPRPVRQLQLFEISVAAGDILILSLYNPKQSIRAKMWNRISPNSTDNISWKPFKRVLKDCAKISCTPKGPLLPPLPVKDQLFLGQKRNIIFVGRSKSDEKPLQRNLADFFLHEKGVEFEARFPQVLATNGQLTTFHFIPLGSHFPVKEEIDLICFLFDNSTLESMNTTNFSRDKLVGLKVSDDSETAECDEKLISRHFGSTFEIFLTNAQRRKDNWITLETVSNLAKKDITLVPEDPP